ncbi:MAG TPA: excinuclease ABC subunit UvrC [Burkholderiales bacterium]|nr:excinuclease ABC subunit UvrC [Burkholderiales bacterium]
MTLDAKSLIAGLPTAPGVYRMLDARGGLLYVGKARNLKKRVTSYFRGRGLTERILAMMQQVADISVTVTHTETEALLLENNLIKSQHPRYNVLLRDDKSYPYIFVSDTQTFPRIGFHRGAKRERGRYFGPYPSATSVRESLGLMQKIFPVRQCEDSFFRNRSRPCLQHQIRRCTAPCVGLITPERYRDDVRHALLFLEGRTRDVIDDMVQKMEHASEQRDYELAATYRDRIAALKRLQAHQYINVEGGDADVLAVVVAPTAVCVEASFIRAGLGLGNKTFFPKISPGTPAEEVLAAFVSQHYLGTSAADSPVVPPRIYLNQPLAADNKLLLEHALSTQAGRKIALVVPRQGAPKRWVRMAEINAADALRRLLADKTSLRMRFEALREALALDAVPARIECFDISHTQGEAPVAACVVFDLEGPVKSDYRRFNIEGIEPGDDYAALRQAVERRYRRLKTGEGKLPDLLLIDGGKGQVSVVHGVLEELQIEGVPLVGVAKGRERRPGKEQLFLSGSRRPTILPADSAALHLIQQIRDEAHRFAITGHRLRRGKARRESVLEHIPGIGDKRRQLLLKNFGGLREVARAGVEDLARVPGISRELAQKIYDTFHEQDH